MKHVDEPPRHPKDVNPAVPEELDAMTAKLLTKKPEDRYASAGALAEDLRRVRDGLKPLAAGLWQKTREMPKDTARTRPVPTAVAPRRRTRRSLLALGAVLLALVLLGGLAWALSREPSNPSNGAAQRVEVPDVVGLSLEEAQGRLDKAGLKLGSRTEAASSETTAGSVISQDPAAGSEADRGTAVDVVVSSGPAPAPTTQSSSASSSTSSSASAAPASPTASPSAPAEPQKQTREPRKQTGEPQRKAQEPAKEQQKVQRGAEKGPREQKSSHGGKGKD